MKNILYYLIYIISGWKSIRCFGYPSSGTYIVCLENKAVMEMEYSDFTSNRWFKLGIGDECILNKVIYYKKLPKSKICI